jgi:two-component system, LytTR family, response regulator
MLARYGFRDGGIGRSSRETVASSHFLDAVHKGFPLERCAESSMPEDDARRSADESPRAAGARECAREMRALIVDDESLAREWLRELLAEHSDVEVLGECDNGREAIEVIARIRPDLVFLDVQMPGVDGFEVLRGIPAEGMPAIVFVTAHDRHALRAFDAHALDYLLKPFDGERLKRALDHARTRLSGAAPSDWTRRLFDLIESRLPAVPLDRLVIRSGRGVFLLRAQDVDWVHSEGNYVRIRAGKESYLVRETISDLETRLPPERFARIHKSILVNIDRIRQIQPLANGGHIVLLTDGTKLTWSRGFRSRLRALTGSED